MMREPKIPMLPMELPQQRIHEVVELPERPEPFNWKGGLLGLPIWVGTQEPPAQPHLPLSGGVGLVADAQSD